MNRLQQAMFITWLALLVAQAVILVVILSER